ncbi:MAG: hypothetical protein Q9227_001523 [Pyrenula ochraceoflavens]
MFAASRAAILNSCRFRRSGGDTKEVDDDNFRHGKLRDDDILAWVNQQGPFAPKPNAEAGKLLGQIRLLIYERTSYSPLDFAVSKDLFVDIERSFKLHPATLPGFDSDAGTFSRYLTFSDKDRTQLERISFILKAPQKREIGNYGLSLTHEVATGTTTALLYGKGVLIRPEADDFWPHIPSLLELLQQSTQLWSHPLLLPCLLLGDHMRRAKWFAERGTVMTETVQIEQELGVVKVGRKADIIPGTLSTYQEQSAQPYGGDFSRSRALSLTVRINTNSTRILFTARSPEWNKACSKFTLQVLDELKLCLPEQQDSHVALEELLKFNVVIAEAAAHHVAGLQERMALQLNVLYNFVAQKDNRLSAKLAASAGRDSVSMKILAFISAIFLPGSFISGMFSISMFDWQHNADPAVISSRFWIYWVITIPLTALTLVGWGVWWGIEIKRFEKGFSDALEEREEEKVELKHSQDSMGTKLDGGFVVHTSSPSPRTELDGGYVVSTNSRS